MNFCHNLCRDINFEPTSVQPCCDVHGIEVPTFHFQGGRLDMAAYARHIESVFSRLQTDGDKLCRGCPQLETFPNTQRLDVRMLFRTVSINMHRHFCNCHCVYCNLWQKHTNDGYLILPALQSLDEQKALHPQCAFSWGGGEPSILPDFEETSQWIMEQPQWTQYVHTSGLKFSPAIATLLRDGRGAIDVSLDSASPAVYQKVKGLDGFGKVCDNLAHYAQNANNPTLIQLKYIIFELNNNLQEIEKFLLLCANLGVICVQYSLNFLELNSAGPAVKTLLGAAFFSHRAPQLGLQASPFFIPPTWQAKIDALRQEHFGD